MSPKSADVVREEPNGLIARGKIIGRTRAQVGDPPLEKVTYRIFADDNTMIVARLDKHEYASIGEDVAWPVKVRVFMRRNGMVGYSLNVDDKDQGFGEEF